MRMAKQRTNEELHRRKIPRLGCLPHEWYGPFHSSPVCSSPFHKSLCCRQEAISPRLGMAWRGAAQHAVPCRARRHTPALAWWRIGAASVALHSIGAPCARRSFMASVWPNAAAHQRPLLVESFLVSACGLRFVRRGARQVVAPHRRCRRLFRRARCSDSAACRPARPHSTPIALTAALTAVAAAARRTAHCDVLRQRSSMRQGDGAGPDLEKQMQQLDAAALGGEGQWLDLRGQSHLADCEWPIPLRHPT